MKPKRTEQNEPQLIFALDMLCPTSVAELMEEVRGHVSWVKLGQGLFHHRYNFDFYRLLREFEREPETLPEFFYDAKLVDIPSQVERACAAIAFTRAIGAVSVVPRSGVLEAAVNGLEKGPLDAPRARVWALLELTSEQEPPPNVIEVAERALAEGADGLICSVETASLLRQRLPEETRLICPGITLEGRGHKDQKRGGTPELAVRCGANYIVVGRSVLNAKDKLGAVRTIRKSIRKASSQLGEVPPLWKEEAGGRIIPVVPDASYDTAMMKIKDFWPPRQTKSLP